MLSKKTVIPAFLFILSSSLVATSSVRAGDIGEVAEQAADNYEAIRQGAEITTESNSLVEIILYDQVPKFVKSQAWVSPRWSTHTTDDKSGCNSAGLYSNSAVTRISALNVGTQAASVTITYYDEAGAVTAVENLGLIQPGGLGVHEKAAIDDPYAPGAGWVTVIAGGDVLVDGSIHCRYQASRVMTWYPYPYPES